MTHHKKPEISKRLARIEGHVGGIQRLVNEDKTYAMDYPTNFDF